MSETKPDPFLKQRKAQGPKLARSKGGWRAKLVWGVVVAALLAGLAYLSGIVGGREAREPKGPVAEGPPPVVKATGYVVPTRRARLSFTATGKVKRLAAQPGDRVKQGQLLAQLEPSAVQVGSLGDSALQGWAPSISDLYIVAPFDGTVGLVPVNEWETVAPGTPVVVLGDLSTMRVEIEDLSETYVGRLTVGQSAEITFEAFPGRKVAGRVARISPMSNSKGGGVNYDVVVEFADPNLPPLRWGMTASVDILVER